MLRKQMAGECLFCLAVIVGVAATGHSQAFARIAAKVVDQDGNPVEGALVTVTSPEVPSFKYAKTTNKRGQTVVTFTVGTAMHDFVIEKEGFQILKVEVLPRVGTIEERVFTLLPVGAVVAGEPQAPSGAPTGPTLARPKVRRYNEGVEAQQEGDLDAAMAAFREAVEIDPGFAPAYTGIATVAVEQGDYEQAAAAAEKAVELDPEDFRALQLRYDAYRNLGDEAKAAAAADALREAGDIAEATARTFQEGVAAYQAGDSDTAKARFCNPRKSFDDSLMLIRASFLNIASAYS